MNKGHIKRKILFKSIFFIIIGFVLVKSIFQTTSQIYMKQKEKDEYAKLLKELQDKEEELNNTVTKLQDPDYIARYAREKYLFSKDGEIIIRVPE